MEKDLEMWNKDRAEFFEEAKCAIYIIGKDGTDTEHLRESFEKVKKALANLEVEVKQCDNLNCRYPLHQDAVGIEAEFHLELESFDPEIFEKLEEGCPKDSE